MGLNVDVDVIDLIIIVIVVIVVDIFELRDNVENVWVRKMYLYVFVIDEDMWNIVEFELSFLFNFLMGD